MDAAAFPYDGPSALRQPVVDALSSVVDPEAAMSIVDMGLVYGVQVLAGVMWLRLTMTSAACPVAELIAEQAAGALELIAPAGIRVEVDLVWDPPWTPERMSQQGKDLMGW